MNLKKVLEVIAIGLLVLIASTISAFGQQVQTGKEREVIIIDSGKKVGEFDGALSLRVAKSVQFLLNSNGAEKGMCLFSDLARDTLLIGRRRGYVQVVLDSAKNEIRVTADGLDGPYVELRYEIRTVLIFGARITLPEVAGVILPETKKAPALGQSWPGAFFVGIY